MNTEINNSPFTVPASKTSFLSAVCAAVLVASTSLSAGAGITTLDLSTGNPAIWGITGAGASGATAFGNSAWISITSNARIDGSLVSGGSLADFDGFWSADTSFFLPADATNAVLTFSGFGGDDRGVVELNGQIVGNFFLNNSGEGVMSFSPGNYSAFTFSNQRSNTVTSGFLLGQTNHLLIIVNNTDSSNLNAETRTFNDSIDGTVAYLSATVSYGLPEPSVSIATYAGLTISGVVGQTYGIQTTSDINAGSWTGVTNVILTQPTLLWYDSQPTSQLPKRFFRVVAGPISIP